MQGRTPDRPSSTYNDLREVSVFTDGACLGNPGPGGYSAILVFGAHRKELAGGFRLTTNNRMEIYAAIIGLRALKTRCDVTVYTDSRYLADAVVVGGARRWQANGWRRGRNEKALNPDLWQILLDLCDRHVVRFEWIRGHAGHPENEMCDRLSNEAARRQGLPPDVVYEQNTGLGSSAPEGLFDSST